MQSEKFNTHMYKYMRKTVYKIQLFATSSKIKLKCTSMNVKTLFCIDI